MGSASEAETGGLHHNCQEACPIRVALKEMGWMQPPTPVQTDNAVASGIANGAVKQRRSRAIDMRFCWIRDRVKQGQFRIHWKPGKENLADYFTKHHAPSHHQAMQPIYPHVEAEPGATKPDKTSVRGCVDGHPGPTEVPPSIDGIGPSVEPSVEPSVTDSD